MIPELSHVGYFLIGKGVVKIEKEAKMRSTIAERCQKICQQDTSYCIYRGNNITNSFLSWGLIAKAYQEGLRDWMLARFWCYTIFSCQSINYFTYKLADNYIIRTLFIAKDGFFKRHT